jgi:serine/threonine-protein kinase
MSASEAQAPLDPTSLLPRKFGRYALFDFIGKGGMAEIFLARAHTELGASRLCVVKQILPEFALHPQFADMLIHEAKLAARLNHAHIVQVFDLGRERDQLYIAMDYVEGFDLNALLRRCSQQKVPLPFEFALRVVSDALKGLDYAHRRTSDDGKPLGIVHRDVSPSNVLVSLEGEVKLCDFGIARANDIVLKEDDLRMDEAIKGKAGYMSPEHAQGEPVDARADVFAVGIVMWELLAGRRMYRKESEVPLLEQAKRAEIPELPPKDLPLEHKLHAIVHRALAKNKDDRYPTANAMLRDLDAFMSEAKIVASPLKLGDWLMDHFGAELIAQRRARDKMALPAESAPPSDRHATPSVPSGTAVARERTSAAPPAPAPPVVDTRGMPKIVREIGLEIGKLDPDPPSLPASTVDVVPSSAMRRASGELEPRNRSRVLVLLGVAAVIVAGLVLAFARR